MSSESSQGKTVNLQEKDQFSQGVILEILGNRESFNERVGLWLAEKNDDLNHLLVEVSSHTEDPSIALSLAYGCLEILRLKGYIGKNPLVDDETLLEFFREEANEDNAREVINKRVKQLEGIMLSDFKLNGLGEYWEFISREKLEDGVTKPFFYLTLLLNHQQVKNKA